MRTYDISFENVTVSAAQDLVSIKAGAAKAFRVKRARVGATNTSIPTAQMLQIRCRATTGVLTLGSGGTVPTAIPLDPGDTAFSGTNHVNDTSKATTSTTFQIMEETGVHIYQGYDFTWPMDARPFCLATEGFVFELLSTVSGTVALSGGVTIEEMGG